MRIKNYPYSIPQIDNVVHTNSKESSTVVYSNSYNDVQDNSIDAADYAHILQIDVSFFDNKILILIQ